MPTDDLSTRQRGRPGQLMRRRSQAAAVLRRTDIREALGHARTELGIPAGGFQHDSAGQHRWFEKASDDDVVLTLLDSARERQFRESLAAVGIEWPDHWAITRHPPTSNRAVMRAARSLQLLADLDDTWLFWLQHVLVTGEGGNPITALTAADKAPHLLWIGPADEYASVLDGVGDQQPTYPYISRPIIYVSDDMGRESVRKALEEIRSRQRRETHDDEGPAGARSRPRVARDLATITHELHTLRNAGGSWKDLVRSDAGQRFLLFHGLQDAVPHAQHTAIYNAVYPRLK